MAKPEKPQEKPKSPAEREAMLEENAPEDLAVLLTKPVYAVKLTGMGETDIQASALEHLAALALPGESQSQTLARVLQAYDSLRALLVGPNVVARGLLVKYEEGPGYDKGGKYSVHRVTVDNGAVEVSVCRGMGRVVDGVLKEAHVGAWHHAQEEFASAAEHFVKPEELR